MPTRYAVASGDWSDASNVWSDTDGGAAGAYVPADGDTFVILAGVNVKMDVDQSAWTGLVGSNIIRGGATPGMLYWSNGDSGHLKLRTGASLNGTTDTNRGRILANSDGSWSTSTALQNSNKAVIDLQGTAAINCTNLDVRLYGTEPTNKYVHVYGTKYDFNGATAVDPDNDTIDLGTTPPSAGTDVILLTSGTLPTGLVADTVYYIRSISGNTCKLALQNNDEMIVNITAEGSGTISMLTEPSSGAGTDTLNVLEDVTADSPWSATDGHDRAVLVDAGAPADNDQQRVTISAITDADTIVISATIDSGQYAGCKLFLSSRNVSIRSAGTSSSQAIVNYATDDTHGGIYQCEIVNTGGSGTTFYGYGIEYGSGHTISGSISGCNNGINSGSGHTISGSISGCNDGINSGSGHTISGSISGCSYGINSGSGHTISGSISGCGYGINYGSGHTISGSISGCIYGINSGSGHTISGSISGCIDGINSGSGHTISGSISGCNNGISGSGYTISGSISGCSSSFRYPLGFSTVKSGANVTYTYSSRNTVGYVGRISVEDYAQTANDHRAFDAFGDIIKIACDGTGDAPSEDPDGGNGYAIEASNIQSNLTSINPLVIIPNHRIWLTAAEHTITYKVQTTYAGITAGNLKLSVSYISTASPVARTIATNAPAISQRSSDTDWTQTLAVTITPVAAGWVDCTIELMEYESGNEVWIWPTPTIT